MTVHRFPTFDRDDFGPEYRPNLVDQLAAEWEQADQWGGGRSLIARVISGDCFYLISGAMVALDLVLVIVLVRS